MVAEEENNRLNSSRKETAELDWHGTDLEVQLKAWANGMCQNNLLR